MPTKVAILISGRGSNMVSLLDDILAGEYAEVVRVISNRPKAPGLEKAAARGVPTVAIDHREYPSRGAFEAALDAELRAAGAELVCLAGFMRLLTAPFVEAWRDRLINIHPSLLPAFPGLRTHARALEAGVRFHGCTVHFVRAEMDAGPIIVQAAVPVHAGDDPDALAARVLASEHRVYPWAVRAFAQGRLAVEGDVVRVLDHAAPGEAAVNPQA